MASRDRDRDDQRRAPATEKNEDHQPGQGGGDDPFAKDVRHGLVHERGLIADRLQVESLGKRRPYLRQQRFHAVDHMSGPFPDFDGVLRSIFEDPGRPEHAPSDAPRGPASALFRKVERELTADVFRWTGSFPERTRPLIRHLASRADETRPGLPARSRGDRHRRLDHARHRPGDESRPARVVPALRRTGRPDREISKISDVSACRKGKGLAKLGATDRSIGPHFASIGVGNRSIVEESPGVHGRPYPGEPQT